MTMVYILRFFKAKSCVAIFVSHYSEICIFLGKIDHLGLLDFILEKKNGNT